MVKFRRRCFFCQSDAIPMFFGHTLLQCDAMFAMYRSSPCVKTLCTYVWANTHFQRLDHIWQVVLAAEVKGCRAGRQFFIAAQVGSDMYGSRVVVNCKHDIDPDLGAEVTASAANGPLTSFVERCVCSGQCPHCPGSSLPDFATSHPERPNYTKSED